MKYPKRSQYKYAKSQYRVRNWSEYEAGLKKRGDLTVWLARDALDAWRETPSGKPGGAGSQHSLDPRTRTACMEHVLRLQQAEPGREYHVPIQDDHRPKYAKSDLR